MRHRTSSKQNYALAIKQVADIKEENARAITALTFARYFLHMDQNFNETRFLTSCGVTFSPTRRDQEQTCDGCGKQRRDVRSCGRDANGDPDAPDLCFICRKEAERGRFYSFKRGVYLYRSDLNE